MALPIEDGIHPYDIYREGVSKHKVGTREFADAVIERMGKLPEKLEPVEYNKNVHMNLAIRPAGKPPMKMRVGVDLFIDRRDGNPDIIADAMQLLKVSGTKLTIISNRGTKVWPDPNPDTYWSDHWSCRFETDGSELFTSQHVVQLLDAADRAGFDVIKTEALHVQRRARLLARAGRVACGATGPSEGVVDVVYMLFFYREDLLISRDVEFLSPKRMISLSGSIATRSAMKSSLIVSTTCCLP